MVWDLYDGVRTGLADFKGSPCYFSSVFEEEYTDKFEVSPINEEFLALATEQWEIYRDWEMLYHSGKEKLSNHPGHGGISQRYDELENTLKGQLSTLNPHSELYRPEFRVQGGKITCQKVF